MTHTFRTLIAAASIALLASCASTGENTSTDGTQTTDPAAQTQPGAQPGQEAYSYSYGQAPDSYEGYDTAGGGTGGGAGGRQGGGQYGQAGRAGQYGQGTAGGGAAVSADRVVYFDFDSAEILPQSQAVIDTNARYLSGNPRIITQLEGHTDERGSREYNIALGERRANAVRQVMIARGVSPQQVRVISYGEERPAAGGQDEQSYALNRRVEIVY